MIKDIHSLWSEISERISLNTTKEVIVRGSNCGTAHINDIGVANIKNKDGSLTPVAIIDIDAPIESDAKSPLSSETKKNCALVEGNIIFFDNIERVEDDVANGTETDTKPTGGCTIYWKSCNTTKLLNTTSKDLYELM